MPSKQYLNINSAGTGEKRQTIGNQKECLLYAIVKGMHKVCIKQEPVGKMVRKQIFAPNWDKGTI
jgi:hypothetical protein